MCSKMPFSSGIQTFSRIRVLIFRSVQLILSIRRHTYISKAVSSFSSHFFSVQLSDPYNAVLHISDCTSCFFRSMPMSFAFQIPVSCRVACLAIVSLAFISAVLLLSTVTNDPKYLNLFILSISMPSTNTRWVPISVGSLLSLFPVRMKDYSFATH